MISSKRPAAQYRVTEETKRCEGTLLFDPTSLGISFHLEYARRSLARDEAYRGRERLTVTVTRYRNARNAPCYINFGLRPQGEVDRKEDRRIPGETTATAHASGRK